jgi:hypothetical protein
MADEAEIPARQVVLGGVLFALATFGLLWAIPVLLMALQASAA